MFNPNRIRTSPNARASLPPTFMQTLAQRFPNAAIYEDGNYVEVQVEAPLGSNEFAMEMQRLGYQHGYTFDGMTEEGYPCWMKG
jgi:hypothetical protein